MTFIEFGLLLHLSIMNDDNYLVTEYELENWNWIESELKSVNEIEGQWIKWKV